MSISEKREYIVKKAVGITDEAELERFLDVKVGELASEMPAAAINLLNQASVLMMNLSEQYVDSSYEVNFEWVAKDMIPWEHKPESFGSVREFRKYIQNDFRKHIEKFKEEVNKNIGTEIPKSVVASIKIGIREEIEFIRQEKEQQRIERNNMIKEQLAGAVAQSINRGCSGVLLMFFGLISLGVLSVFILIY